VHLDRDGDEASRRFAEQARTLVETGRPRT
jgi:hypothetical protein